MGFNGHAVRQPFRRTYNILLTGLKPILDNHLTARSRSGIHDSPMGDTFTNHEDNRFTVM